MSRNFLLTHFWGSKLKTEVKVALTAVLKYIYKHLVVSEC